MEVVAESEAERPKLAINAIKPADEKWLIEKIEYKFSEIEAMPAPNGREVDGLYVLVGALKVLGLDGGAQSFIARLSELKKKL